MCGVGSFRWDCVLLGSLGGNVCCWVFEVAMCVFVCFKWQCVVLGLLVGHVCCWVL